MNWVLLRGLMREARHWGEFPAMLRAALPIAAGLDINPALITCDLTNVASRRVIEHAGGQLAEADDTKLRFWVATRPV